MSSVLKVLSFVVGLVLIIGAVVEAIWYEVFYCFVGGAIQLIHGVAARPLNDHDIEWGLLRFFIFGGFGTLVAVGVIVVGSVLVGYGVSGKSPRNVRRRSFRR